MSLSRRRAVLFLAACIVGAALVPCGAPRADGGDEEEERGGIVFFPILFYTPETRFGAGASLVYYFRGAGEDSTARLSTIQPTVIYTQENQIVSSLGTDIYWSDEAYRLDAGIGYVKFPDVFYGIGPRTADSMSEDYTPETFLFYATLFRKVRSYVRLGLRYEYRHESILKREKAGLLDLGDIPGSRGGDISGLGLSLDWDTRENVFYPLGGSYHSVSATFFDGRIGGDFAFNRYIVDLRKYFSLGAAGVLAVQGFGHFSSGTPPFQMMAILGGQDKGRGYYGGRFRDRNSLVAQAELRRMLLKSWGVVLFAGAGAVAPQPDAFTLGEAKPSGGFGVRYVFSAKEKINIRLDFGFAESSSGFYITVGEAF